MSTTLRSLRVLAIALIAAAASAALPTVASAQSIAVTVNGQAILSSEVASRAGLMKLTGGQPATAEKELIDEKIKLGEAKRYGITPDAKQVDAAFAGIAERAKMSPEQFVKALGQRGVNAQTLKDRLGAEIVWATVVRGKFASKLASQERDVANAIARKGGVTNKATQYSLMQVIFVMPKTASPAEVNKRKAEAMAARARWQGCSQSVKFATSLRDVAVRDPINRSTGQLGKQMSESLAKIKLNGLTEPQRSDEGLEMIAVCDRKEINDDSVLNQQAQEESGGKQAMEQSDKYLAQLRAKAVIVNVHN